jgi:hypothetical protein
MKGVSAAYEPTQSTCATSTWRAPSRCRISASRRRGEPSAAVAAGAGASTAGALRCHASVGSARSGSRIAQSANRAVGEESISAPPATAPTSAPASIAPSWALVAAARRSALKRSTTSARCAVLAAFSPMYTVAAARASTT